MKIIVGIFCGAVILTLLLWFKRSPNRKLGDVDAEILKWKSLPTDDLGMLCILDIEDDLEDRAAKVAKMLGWKGFLAIERKSKGLIRIFQSGNKQYSGFLDDKDLEYIATKLAALRMEMPWVVLELISSSISESPMLHAFRAVALYCQIVGCISDAAISSGSSGMMKLVARL